MKKLWPLLIAIVMLLGLMDGAGYAESEICLLVNGQEIHADVAPQMIDSRVMVPVRFVAEALGAQVTWDNDSQAVGIKKDDTSIKMMIGQKVVTRNSTSISLDVPAMLVEDRTMVPVRFVSEGLGCDVQWDEAHNSVIITTIADNKQATTPAAGAPQQQSAPVTTGSDTPKGDLTATASVVLGQLNFKQVTVKSTNVPGGVKYSVGESKTVRPLGKGGIVLSNESSVLVKIFAADGVTILGTGNLTTTTASDSLTFKIAN